MDCSRTTKKQERVLQLALSGQNSFQGRSPSKHANCNYVSIELFPDGLPSWQVAFFALTSTRHFR